MFRTFNMGIGYIAVVAEESVDRLARGFESFDIGSSVIGRIVEGDPGLEIA